MSRVALVILNYNGSSFLNQFLPQLISNSPEAEIIVADNCSTDNSLDILKKYESVRTISLPENYGYAGGYNEALKEVKSTYFLLVNSDIEVTSGWISPLLNFLETHPDYAAVQPKILDFNNKQHFEYAGAAGGFLDQFGYPYCRGRVFNTLETDTGQYDDPCDVFWATGACFLIRSEVFRELGGFDASFFAHMEEIDLFWRLHSSGKKAVCIPASRVYHVGGGTLHKSSHRKTYLNFRNNLRLIIKNLPVSQLWFVLPIRVLLDWLAAFVFWKNESFSHFKAIFKAHFDVLKTLSTDWSKTERSQPTLDNQPTVNLLFQYYFRKKKTFKEINNTK